MIEKENNNKPFQEQMWRIRCSFDCTLRVIIHLIIAYRWFELIDFGRMHACKHIYKMHVLCLPHDWWIRSMWRVDGHFDRVSFCGYRFAVWIKHWRARSSDSWCIRQLVISLSLSLSHNSTIFLSNPVIFRCECIEFQNPCIFIVNATDTKAMRREQRRRENLVIGFHSPAAKHHRLLFISWSKSNGKLTVFEQRKIAHEIKLHR